jgi:hypothetical protein
MKFLLPVLCAGLLLYVTLSGLGINREFATAEALSFCFTLGLGIAAVLGAVKAYPTHVGIEAYAVALGLAIGLACSWVSRYLSLRLIGGSVSSPEVWLSQTKWVRWTLFPLLMPAIGLIDSLSKRARTLEARFAAYRQAEKLLRDAELYRLRQQFQPHFLYNSLNSINALISIDHDRAQTMVGTLADYLRRSVKQDGGDNVALGDELAHLRAYLSIEAIRFGERLRVNIECSANEHQAVPPFLLQPLLENAIKFGVYGTIGVVDIRIHLYNEGEDIILRLSNPFDPDSRPPKGTGFGLRGLRRRLELLYSRTDLLQTHLDDGVFLAILRIPSKYDQGITG